MRFPLLQLNRHNPSSLLSQSSQLNRDSLLSQSSKPNRHNRHNRLSQTNKLNRHNRSMPLRHNRSTISRHSPANLSMHLRHNLASPDISLIPTKPMFRHKDNLVYPVNHTRDRQFLLEQYQPMAQLPHPTIRNQSDLASLASSFLW
jgi:hypothetical protein